MNNNTDTKDLCPGNLENLNKFMKTTKRVLIVEDNAGDVELIKEALCINEGYDIKVINNGEDAIEFLKLEDDYVNKTLPDLILLDLNLPKADGKEVLHFIKNDDALKEFRL